MKTKKRNLVKEITEELIRNLTAAKKLVAEREHLDQSINEYKDANRHQRIRDKFSMIFVPVVNTHWRAITLSAVPATEVADIKPENMPEIRYALGVHDNCESFPTLHYVEAKQLKNLRDYLNTLELE